MDVELDRHFDGNQYIRRSVVEVDGIPRPERVCAILVCLLQQLERAIVGGVGSAVESEGRRSATKPFLSTNQHRVVAVQIKSHFEARCIRHSCNCSKQRARLSALGSFKCYVTQWGLEGVIFPEK